jgi:acetylornithine deacetylase/succinyl-diaminopimelate desuccinylase-like protein
MSLTESSPLLQALRYAQDNQGRHLNELFDFLRIPSISARPEHTADVQAAAEWLAGNMRQAGLENVRIIPTKRHPLIYADWLRAGPEKPTVLIYGHYDVQPADPLELWRTLPFSPTVRDNYVYARGASDDKGQTLIHVKAVASYLQSGGSLPVNVKFIIEGEEESGGENLAEFIPGNPDLLQADVALISDTAMLNCDQPSIVYGTRGICYIFLDVTGPAHDLHSGSFGGGVNNPINALAHIIAQLKDSDGRILIPGFYDKVRSLSDDERAMLAQNPLVSEQWLAETGAPALWGEPEYSLVERLGARPTLDVNGIIGGYTEAGAKTVLPATAHAKLSMRLVPDQEPQEIADLLISYIESIAPPSITVKATYAHGAPASITNLKIPAMQAAAAAYTQVFGCEPIYTREGGSLPVVGHFQRQLGLETILMGFGLPDDRIHSPNERFYLPNFYRGIETAVHFLAEYAALTSNQ